MKILVEETMEVFAKSKNAAIENSTNPVTISYLRNAIQSEQEAILEYETILEDLTLDGKQIATISEILDDEKDHIVLLTGLLQDLTKEVYPSHGEE